MFVREQIVAGRRTKQGGVREQNGQNKRPSWSQTIQINDKWNNAIKLSNKTVQSNRNIDLNTESIRTLIVTAHTLSVDSKQGGVHGQNQATILARRQRKHIKEYNKKYNKKRKTTETSIQKTVTMLGNVCITAYRRRRNSKRTRIFSLAFTVIEPFGVLTKKARTAVLALGSLELRASLAVLALKWYSYSSVKLGRWTRPSEPSTRSF